MAYEYVVDAKANSVTGGTLVNTGLALTKGQLLTVTVPVDEKWSYGSGADTNANGSGNPFGTPMSPWQKAANGLRAYVGSLVGSLDGGQTFFAIGTHLEMTVLVDSGTLSLGYWDSDAANNNGSVTAAVAVYTGPKTT